jgi:hypothetical protein
MNVFAILPTVMIRKLREDQMSKARELLLQKVRKYRKELEEIMESRQAIETKYIGPTNTRGAKVKASCYAGSLTIDWDDHYTLQGGVLKSGVYAFVQIFKKEGSNE